MFNPIHTEHTTNVLGAPIDWNEEKDGKCIGLPVHYNGKEFYSWWKVSLKDRIKILFGRPIRLVIFTQSHPPVAMDTET